MVFRPSSKNYLQRSAALVTSAALAVIGVQAVWGSHSTPTPMGAVANLGAVCPNPTTDYISRVFRDAAYLPRVYDEADVLCRYGKGNESTDAAGLIRRRYRDPSTGLEVVITSNPDVAPAFRTVDEIRVSSIATGQHADETAEGLADLKLKGVRIGDPPSKAISAARNYGPMNTSHEKLARFNVERVCGFSDGGSNICFFVHENRVVAMAVGFGP